MSDLEDIQTEIVVKTVARQAWDLGHEQWPGDYHQIKTFVLEELMRLDFIVPDYCIPLTYWRHFEEITTPYC